MGPMLGGTKLYVAGPCFKQSDAIVAKFADGTIISGSFGSELEATVTVPVLDKTGSLPIQLSTDGGNTFKYGGDFMSGKGIQFC